jgi:hypothetical protein
MVMGPWLKKYLLVVVFAGMVFAILWIPAVINSKPVPPPAAHKSVSATDILSMCPPGHRVEFRYGATSLYVDLRWVSWITTGSLVYEKFGGVCPTVPVEGIGLFFGGARSGDIKQDFVDRGLPSWLQISSALRMPNPSLIPSAPETRIHLPTGGYVENITPAGSIQPGKSAFRQYKLQHPADIDGIEPPPITMGCSGNPDAITSSSCQTLYSYNSDFRVNYRFEKRSWNPLHVRDNAVANFTEPQDLLAFDANVRAFVADLMKKP